jgi:hypothetical protein
MTYPRSARTTQVAQWVVDEFQNNAAAISSKSGRELTSNEVLEIVRPGLERIGFAVEKDKTSSGKIKVPVLFGLNGTFSKTFDADGFHQASGIVLEVEAGRAVSNYQFLKDLFQACMMQDAQHLIIAVRQIYKGNHDFDSVTGFFETLYVSGRMNLPLTSVTIVGY